jgi:hypothetical protein
MTLPFVTIHGKFVQQGQPAAGFVVFTDPAFAIDGTDGSIQTPVMIQQYLDQNGEFWADLPLNVGPGAIPADRHYYCQVDVENASTQFDFILPVDFGTLEFSDLIPVTPVISPAAPYVHSIGGLSGIITYDDFVTTFPTLSPAAGKSAYQLWLEAGHIGGFDAYLLDITGPQGLQGIIGPTGLQGPQGQIGPRGPVGPRGRPFFVAAILDTEANLLGGGVVVVDATDIGLPIYSIVAVLATNAFYMFDGSEWVYLGSYQGPQGIAGHTPTATEIGLGNVDNTSDLNKPVSTDTQAALDALAASVGQVDSVNGHTGVVVLSSADVGLGNVDNTSDATKPISTLVQDQLTGINNQLTNKQGLLPGSGSANVWLNGTLNWSAPTPAQVGLGNVQNFPNMGSLTVQNLNTLTTTGTYAQPTSSSAVVALNYPITRAGFLQVLGNTPTPTMTVQYYTAYGTATLDPVTYRRVSTPTGGWSAWQPMVSADPSPTVIANLLVAEAGWTIDSQASYLIQPNLLAINAIQTRTGAAIANPPSGNIANVPTCHFGLPGYHPALARMGMCTASAGRLVGLNLDAGGTINICSLAGTSDFATGEQFSFGDLVPLVGF